jgi:hypothetical protein
LWKKNFCHSTHFLQSKHTTSIDLHCELTYLEELWFALGNFPISFLSLTFP